MGQRCEVSAQRKRKIPEGDADACCDGPYLPFYISDYQTVEAKSHIIDLASFILNIMAGDLRADTYVTSNPSLFEIIMELPKHCFEVCQLSKNTLNKSLPPCPNNACLPNCSATDQCFTQRIWFIRLRSLQQKFSLCFCKSCFRKPSQLIQSLHGRQLVENFF